MNEHDEGYLNSAKRLFRLKCNGSVFFWNTVYTMSVMSHIWMSEKIDNYVPTKANVIFLVVGVYVATAGELLF